MKIAEKLYTQGFISYPRTETTIFPPSLNRPIVENQTGHPLWGSFARWVLDVGVNPRQGHKTDNAHPPIYPTKKAYELGGDEGRVYKLVTRHFLACVSKDALGSETKVQFTQPFR